MTAPTFMGNKGEDIVAGIAALGEKVDALGQKLDDKLNGRGGVLERVEALERQSSHTAQDVKEFKTRWAIITAFATGALSFLFHALVAWWRGGNGGNGGNH